MTEVIDTLEAEEEALLDMARSARLFALPIDQNEILFPAWQFDAKRRSRLVPGLTEILSIAPHDPWGVADLLTHRQPTLGGRSPISALRGSGDRGAARMSAATALLRSIDLVRSVYTD